MSSDEKLICKYGANCYRKNIEHINKYDHPIKQTESDISTICESNRSPSKEKLAETSNTEINLHANKKQKLTTITSYFQKKTDPKTERDVTHIEQKPHSDIINETLHNVSNISFADFLSNAQKKEKIALQKEYENLLKNPDEFIRHKFLVTMPNDFYHFWDWCTETKAIKPEDIFIQFGLELVGPFDLLAGKFNSAKIFEPAEYLRHHRYYYDTPEFQSVLVKQNSGIHYGYWRDDPISTQCFIAVNDYEKGSHIKIVASDIFGGIIHFLNNFVSGPNSENAKQYIPELLKHSSKYGNFEELNKKRNKKVVCKTFHKCGLVVSVDKKHDVGYRPLLDSDDNLMKLLKTVEKSPESAIELLQPHISAASIACDEGDFGTSLELGIDLFCSGSQHLHEVILPLMINGYMMTKRPQFLAILKEGLRSNELEWIQLNFNL